MNRADNINPIPKLIKIKQVIGYMRHKNFQVNVIPSNQTKVKYIRRIIPKLIKAETFFEKRNKYLETLILLKIFALPINAFMPSFVDSVK